MESNSSRKLLSGKTVSSPTLSLSLSHTHSDSRLSSLLHWDSLCVCMCVCLSHTGREAAAKRGAAKRILLSREEARHTWDQLNIATPPPAPWPQPRLLSPARRSWAGSSPMTSHCLPTCLVRCGSLGIPGVPLDVCAPYSRNTQLEDRNRRQH